MLHNLRFIKIFPLFIIIWMLEIGGKSWNTFKEIFEIHNFFNIHAKDGEHINEEHEWSFVWAWKYWYIKCKNWLLQWNFEENNEVEEEINRLGLDYFFLLAFFIYLCDFHIRRWSLSFGVKNLNTSRNNFWRKSCQSTS